ncbi:DNRLRE domain-containing protein [Thermodesulfobacteriota bacterium]
MNIIRKKWFWSIKIAFLFCSVISHISYAETVTLYPTDDGHMWETEPGGDGSADFLSVGYESNSDNLRACLKFDISSIPEGSTINSATLKLHYYEFYVSWDERNMSAHRITSDWAEGSITWNNDYSEEIYDQQSVGGGTIIWYGWDVTSLVTSWLQGTYENYGIMIKSYSESGTSDNSLRFESKENDSNHPYLEIDYTLPSPDTELKIESVYPTLGILGQDLEVEIKGEDFNQNTRVAMSLDAGNQRMLTGSAGTPGNATDVFVSGIYAYVADGVLNGLHVVDISNPSNPEVIVESGFVLGAANGVYVSGNYAYVAFDDWDNNTGSLQIIDISDPSNPLTLGSVDTPGIATDVYVSGNYAYVTCKGDFNFEGDYKGGLQIINVSEPLYPLLVDHVDLPYHAHGVTVSGNYAYVAIAGDLFLGGDYAGGLQIIDISVPSYPLPMGLVDLPGLADDVYVSGDYAYVADGGGGLQVVDIIDPESPYITGSADTAGSATDVYISGDYAYVSDMIGGLQQIDISDPLNPLVIGMVNTPGYAYGIFVSGIYAYVADGDSGLQVIDISNPLEPPNITGHVNTPSNAVKITTSGNYAYVADQESGLQIIDITDPSNPLFEGSYDTQGMARDVFVSGIYAYVADGDSRLIVINISDPSEPEFMGSVSTPGEPFRVFVSGIYAYVTNNLYVTEEEKYSYLHVIDISDPENPWITGYVETPGNATGVYVDGGYAYVADMDGGLQVIDISEPTAPYITGSVDVDSFGYAIDVYVSGNYAYVGFLFSGLQVIDINDPYNPQIIGSVDGLTFVNSVHISGSFAYVADGFKGVQVIDISDPYSPLLTGTVELPYFTNGISVSGDYIFVAASYEGLVVVPLPIEITPVTVNSDTSISVTLPSPLLAGHYTLRVFNETGSSELYGAVSFTGSATVSKAIIVAGGGPYQGNWLWEETNRCANYAYRALLYQGYTRENIYYLNPVNADIDGNGDLDDIDGNVTSVKLSYAINDWASDADDLVIYMVDHGGDGIFRLNASELLSAGDLDTWMDDLQETMTGRIIFIYDACMSGTFIPLLTPPEGKEDDRIIITSTENTKAIFMQDGRVSFSYQFWAAIFEGATLVDAFNFAGDMMDQYQTASLDANGNGIRNEKSDVITGISIGRGFIPASDIPYINDISAPQTLDGGTSAVLWASGLIDADGISKVWAIITPPDYAPDEPDIPVTDLDLPTIDLLDPDGDKVYEGTYTDFNDFGTYTVTIYAMDEEGNISMPKITTVYQSGSVDIFEEDDTLGTAGVIILEDEMAQRHNFHDTGDEDWVKFYGIAGEFYTIETSNYGENPDNDIVIELYNSSGTKVDEQDTGGDPNAEEFMDWNCLSDGFYYVKIRQYDPGVYSSGTGYDLNIHHPFLGEPGPLTGIVVNSIGGFIGNAVVMAESDEYNSTAITRNNGTYEMVLPSGSYTISVDASGYISDYEENFGVEAEGYNNQDFILYSDIDSDSDGIPDYMDGCDNDPEKTAPGVCGCGVADTDSDGDGVADCIDDDYDNDGMPDEWEDQNGLDSLVDDADDDADGDGFSNLQEYNRGTDPQDAESHPSRGMPWLMLLLDEE